MAASDAVARNITTIYLTIIAGIKAYGLTTGHIFTGPFVLATSTAVLLLVLVVTLTWDVSRKSAFVNFAAVVEEGGGSGGDGGCRGGICWHG